MDDEKDYMFDHFLNWCKKDVGNFIWEKQSFIRAFILIVNIIIQLNLNLNIDFKLFVLIIIIISDFFLIIYSGKWWIKPPYEREYNKLDARLVNFVVYWIAIIHLAFCLYYFADAFFLILQRENNIWIHKK